MFGRMFLARPQVAFQHRTTPARRLSGPASRTPRGGAAAVITEQSELPNLALERLHDQPERVPDHHPASHVSPGASQDESEAAVADQVFSLGTPKMGPSSFAEPSLTDHGHPVT